MKKSIISTIEKKTLNYTQKFLKKKGKGSDGGNISPYGLAEIRTQDLRRVKATS